MDLNKIIIWAILLLILTSSIALAKEMKIPKEKPIEKPMTMSKAQVNTYKIDIQARTKEKIKEVKVNTPNPKFKLTDGLVANQIQIGDRWITQITSVNKFNKQK